MATDPKWRERYADRLGPAAEAVSVIEPGQRVFAGCWTSTPRTLCAALMERAGDLSGITVVNALSTISWDQPKVVEHFRVVNAYCSALDRQGAREGRFEYLPVAQWRAGQVPPGIEADVAMIPISPPDEEGWCSFGAATWFGPTYADAAKILIGEVHPEYIRTGGQNRVHISKFARLAEAAAGPAPAVVAPRSEETDLAARIICTLVASEIVYDGATVQFGIGDVSAALPVFLGERRELGIHTELLPGGIPDLIEQGVVTGSRKALHPGKVVAAAAAMIPTEDLDYINENPMFEFYDFTYTDDLRNLLQFENFVAVNNAMAVDITGNVASEGLGAQIFSGTGGQAAFAVGASTAAGGSVIVLPSSQLLSSGERRPRVVAGHPPGTIVTVHRSFVDFVVTEQGIARLRGKTLRERAAEMISVAHPDLRAELRKEAAKLHGVTV